MRKARMVIALSAAIFGIAISASAQNGLTVRAGGNFPVGTFGQGESINEIALANADATLGGAAIGFNAGLKYQFSIAGNLSAFGTADLFYNGLNSDVKEIWEANYTSITYPSYMNMPVMAGLNYTILDIAGATLWAEAGAGVNFRHISKLSGEGGVGLVTSSSIKTTYALSTTLVWQAGIGVSLDNTITLGLHYYAFGGAPIKGESKVDATLGDLVGGTSTTGTFTRGNLNPSMIVIRLGYTF